MIGFDRLETARAFLCGVVCVCLVSAPVHAGAPSAESLRLLAEAKAAGTQRQFEKARELLLEALRLDPTSYEVAANLGRMELELERWTDASEHLSLAIALLGQRPDQEKLAKVRGWLDRAREQVVRVQVRARPVGAEVTIGEKRARVTADESLEFFAEPGSIKVRASRDGYKPFETSVIGGPGETRTLELQLETAEGKQPQLPMDELSPMPSPTAAGAIGQTRRGALSPVTEPQAGSARPLWPVATGLGLAAAGLAAGAFFTLTASAGESEAERLRAPGDDSACAPGTVHVQQCARLHEKTREVSTSRTWATIGFVGAGAIGVASMAYWLWPGADQAGKPTASARWSEDAAMIHLDGQF